MNRKIAALAVGVLAVLMPTIAAGPAAAAPPNAVVRKIVALGSDGCFTGIGKQVDLRTCETGKTPTSQRWYIYPTKRDGKTLYKMRSQSVQWGGFCLDSNDKGTVYLLECSDSNYQVWESVTGTNFRESRKVVYLRNYQTKRYLTWKDNWGSPDHLKTHPTQLSEFYGEASVVN
jgi:hypothetical protein